MNFFFRDEDLLCSPLLWVKWLWFFQLILFANTAAFFYCLLGFVSHSFWEGDSGEEISTRWHCVENINRSCYTRLIL